MKHETTTLNTKKMLAETLISLLRKNSLSKIKVSEIVSACQINRKTFYYHFADIYELLEWHITQEIIATSGDINFYDITACLEFSIEYMENNSYFKNCVDDPLGRNVIMQILKKNLSPIALNIISRYEVQYNNKLDENLKSFMINLLTNIVGLSIIDTIANNSIDTNQMLLYLPDIIQKSIESFFTQ